MIRLAQYGDEELFLKVKTDPWVMRASISKIIPNPATHHRWYMESMSDQDRFMFVLEDHIGVGRVDVILGNMGEISISIRREYTNYGYGPKTIKEMMSYCKLKYYLARILDKNKNSIKCFKRLGFKKIVNIKHGGLYIK